MLPQQLINSPTAAAPAFPAATRSGLGRTLSGFGVFLLLLLAAFCLPLYDLARFARHSELYSHILLIPFISLYLIWLQRRNLPLDSTPARRLAVFPLLVGLGLLVEYWLRGGTAWSRNDYLALMTLCFLSFLLSGCFLFFGLQTLKAIRFPLGLLIFMIPLPDFAQNGLESFLQHGSADAAYLLLRLSGMPVFREGTVFQLPGFSMEVAPQCSGIHSSLVLFITSLLAGYLLLRSFWFRATLVLIIIPLAILRNGFRIFTLCQLCVRVNPDWINSDLHHHGGPLFFAASLVPFFLLLLLLRRIESRKHKLPARGLSSPQQHTKTRRLR